MVEQLREHPKAVAFGLLLAVTVAWGSTFVVVKGAIAHEPVLGFLAWRFMIGGGLLALARPRALLRLGRRGWLQGAGLGLALAVGYVLQTVGLRYTSAAASGFITGLQVVLTPILAWLLLRNRPTSPIWVATGLATCGLALVSAGGLALGAGELLTIGAAVAFALQIVGLGHWSSPGDAYGLATVQLLTVAACCLLASLPAGPGLPAGAGDWGAILLTAVAATAVAFVVQSWAQCHLSAARAAIVFAMEPVFAAVFAAVTGAHLGWDVLAGGALVVCSMLVAELGLANAGRAGPWGRASRRRQVAEVG